MGENTPGRRESAGRGDRLVRRRLFLKQPNMRRMIYALTPILVSAVYFFGWRVVFILAICNVAGLTSEYVMTRRRGQPISTACFVTCWLYALSLPPTVPWWIAVVGVVVAILFAKEVFGGFGRNFANPAIVGRAFVYVCFPVPLTARWVPALRGFPGGFAHWSLAELGRLPSYLAATGKDVADAVSQASPMWVYRDLGEGAWRQAGSYWDLLTGSIGGVIHTDGLTQIMSAGSMGEGCAALIALSAVYLLVTKTANWRLMLSCLCGLVATNLLFRDAFGFDGPGGIPPVAFNLLAGTTLYVTVFMVTDPVSAPKQKLAQFAYGALIGFLIVVLRWRGVFVAAATFSVLLGNIVGPLLDMGATAWNRRRRAATPEGGA